MSFSLPPAGRVDASFRVERHSLTDIGDWVLRGRLIEREISGRIVIPDSTAASKARIILRCPSNGHGVDLIDPTDSTGRFQITVLETIGYDLDAAYFDTQARLYYKGQIPIGVEETGPALPNLELDGGEPSSSAFFTQNTWNDRRSMRAYEEQRKSDPK